MRGLLLLAALTLTACAHGPRVKAPDPGEGVRLTYDRRDVARCDLINNFEGRLFMGANLDGARKKLATVAGSHGADTVLVTSEFDEYGSIARGEGYACKQEPGLVDNKQVPNKSTSDADQSARLEPHDPLQSHDSLR